MRRMNDEMDRKMAGNRIFVGLFPIPLFRGIDSNPVLDDVNMSFKCRTSNTYYCDLLGRINPFRGFTLYGTHFAVVSISKTGIRHAACSLKLGGDRGSTASSR
jgi:hypothetical protein